MDLVHAWYDDRYWSKILRGTIPNRVHDLHVHDLKVKVMDLEFHDKSFTLKFLGSQYFQTLLLISFMFGMVIDNGPKFYITISTLVHELKVKVMDLEILCHRILSLFNFNGKGFSSVFVKPLMDLIPIWHGDRYWSKILRGTIPIP